jgi:oxygen-independent coproporphyrinogen-3 oxidase
MKTINELVEKYNRPGPRYTSYPPVPFWHNIPSEKEWITHLKDNYQEDVGVDLYVHVPFCESLCYYCGCNRTITKNHDVEDYYLAALLKEWEIYKEKLGFSLKINSLHFGGGTPTFLSPSNLEKLITTLIQNKSNTFIGSIEIDPRTCNDGHIEVLSRLDIKRVSLGIQDFDPNVQKAINRDQSPAMVELLVEKLRLSNFASINFDLIYGLPKQSLDSISKTIEIVAKLKPDLIAFYSYAHLPERIKNQRLIVESDLPSPEKKKELYELGKKLLIENGYVDVGMLIKNLPS